MQEQRVSFSKGLNRDIARNKFPQGHYSYLLNGRLTAPDDSATFDLSNLLGNDLADIQDTVHGPYNRAGFVINGYCTIHNHIILFYAEETASGIDDYTTEAIIDILEYQGNNSYERRQIWRGVGMNFRTDKKIKAVGDYETAGLQKIYWTDYNEVLRFAIITIDVSTYTPAQFEFKGEFILSDDVTPEFNSYTAGGLKVGMIQYAFRFFKNNGVSTLFSPTSRMIPLSRDIHHTQSGEIKGGAVYDPEDDYQSGMGVKLNLNLPSSDLNVLFYDYIEVISLWYSDEYAVPDISIIYRGLYKNIIVDDGIQSYGTIDYGDFLSEQADFIAKDLTVKDQRLFAVNIKDKYFDLDESLGTYWDARAYRFDVNQDLFLYTTTDLVNPEYSLTAASDLSTIDLEADCINLFNNITEDVNDELSDGGEQCKFQSDGTTLGGSGINISYTFSTRSSRILVLGEPNWNKETWDIYDTDNNRDYYLGIKKGFQRDEVYRCGIVFFDTKGRQSFTKWIGDIRMPYMSDTNGRAMFVTNADNLVIEFTVNNIPVINGAPLSWRIVYVKRERTDKSVVATGLAGTMNKVIDKPGSPDEYTYLMTNHNLQSIHRWMYNTIYADAAVQIDVEHDYFEFRSPDISFNEDFTPDFDYMELAGYSTMSNLWSWHEDTGVGSWQWNPEYAIMNPTGIGDDYTVVTYSGLDASTLYDRRKRTVELQKVFQQKNSWEYEENLGTMPIRWAPVYNLPSSTTGGYHFSNGSGLTTKACVIKTDTQFFDGGVDTWPGSRLTIPYMYARKIVFETQYGGLGYEDRSQNIYIAAGEVQIGTTNTTVCERGDIVFNQVVNRRISAIQEWLDDPIAYNSLTDDIKYICESTYNSHLRYDDTYFELKTEPINESFVRVLREYAYTDTNNGVSFEGLCKYNTAYNRVGAAKKFYIKPNIFNQEEDFINLIKYSDIKLPNSDMDNWVTFKPNDTFSVNSLYGAINRVVNFKDELFIFQDNAVAMLNVNPNALVNTSAGEISLGTGAIIQNDQYLTTELGCQDNSDVIKSKHAMYWMCKNNKKLYTFDGEIKSVSDLKGLHSYFNNTIDEDSGLVGVYDNKNSEVILTITNPITNTNFTANAAVPGQLRLVGAWSAKNIFIPGVTYKLTDGINIGWYRFVEHHDTYLTFNFLFGTEFTTGTIIDMSEYIIEKNNFTLAFSELLGSFTSFYSFIPELYIKSPVGYFSSNNSNTLWQHDISVYYNYFYGEAYPFELSLILNYQGQLQGEYTNIKFFSETLDHRGNYLRNQTISNISVRDNYEQSNDVLLYPMDLPEVPQNPSRLILDNSGDRIGRDYYPGMPPLNIEEILIYDNELYRSLINGNSGTPVTNPLDFVKCELCNIRKTVEQWATQIPRYNFEESPSIPTSNRMRGDWVELTLKLKDIVNPTTLREKNFKISDIIAVTDVVLL